MIETIEEETLGFTRQEREKLMFFTRQWIEGMNPRNFPMTNPEVIQEMLLNRRSERQGRIIDHDQVASMEEKKREGYF